MFIFEVKYICTNNIPWPEWYVMTSYLFFWLNLLEFKKVAQILYMIPYWHLYYGRTQIHMQQFYFFYAHVVYVQLCKYL